MTLEEVGVRLEQVTALAERVQKLEQQIASLEGTRALYAYADLRARGYGHNQAYHILHTHGFKRRGRWRITHQQLGQYERGE